MDNIDITFKHSFLWLPDMAASINIDHDARKVDMTLSHFDSALVINAARYIESHYEPIRLIDDISGKTWGRAIIPGQYDLHLGFSGFRCRAYVVEQINLGDQSGLTVSLEKLKTPAATMTCTKNS